MENKDIVYLLSKKVCIIMQVLEMKQGKNTK